MPMSEVVLAVLVAASPTLADHGGSRPLDADAIGQPAGGAMILACDAGSKDPACMRGQPHVFVKTIEHRRRGRPIHKIYAPTVKTLHDDESPKEG